MAKLGRHLVCHDLVVDETGRISDYSLRLADHKRKAVETLKRLTLLRCRRRFL